MSTQDKKIKVVSTADFDNNKIINATIDASENEVIGVGKIDDVLVNGTSVVENKIANIDVPTKVSDLENDSGYTTVADINSEIIANSSYMDNELKEGSFNAVMNDAITKGIEKNKVSVVDSFVDTLPSETLTLGQSVYNTADNKIYKTTYNKEITSNMFNTVGSLSVDTNGIITGFSEDNYLYSNPEWLGGSWTGWRIDKLVFSIAEARYYSTTTIFSIIRRDDNSVLFGIDFFNRGFGSGTLTFYTKRRDGTTVESATVNAAPSSRYELEITSSNYIKLICAGKTELIRYFGSLSGSDDVEDDFYYGISADIKISSKRVTQYPSTYTLGIGKLYAMESIITYQYQGSPSSFHIVWRGDSIVWDEGTSIEKGKIIYDAENYNLYEYDGTKLISILPDMDKYQKKLTAGDNITISGEGYLGFSNTNYLEFINNTAEQIPRVARDFLIKFKLTELNGNSTLLYSEYDTNKYCLLEITDENKLRCTYINSSGVLRTENGTHVFQANKEYWIMVTTDYYPQYIYFLEDNGYTIDTLPSDISAWTFDIESSYLEYMLFVNIQGSLYLGYNSDATNNFLKGSISECRIKNSGGHTIFTLSEAVESETFINHGCLKGPVISAIIPEIDSQLSDVSENPVQNRVIDSALKAMKPITVTDSGNALPSTSGYVLHDTFLNTTDKKIYGTLANAYELNDGSQITTNNATPVAIDYVTGIANNFSFNFNVNQYSYSYLARIGVSSDNFRWVGDRDYRVHFKITSQGTTNAKYMLFGIGHSVGYGSSYIVGVLIQDSKLYINELSSGIGSVSLTVNPVELINYTLEINKEYYLRLLKKSNGEVETVIYEDGYDQIILARNTVAPQINDITTSYGDNPVSLYFGGYWRGSNNDWGYGFNGDIYLLDSMGEFLKPASQLIWDNGTPIINLTSYLDKTNSLLYYYESPDLISVGDGSESSDYSDLTNKPSINNVTLSGNKTASELGLQSELSNTQLSAIDSGITSTKVSTYDGYENTKQDKLTWTYTEATETLEVE